MTSDQKVGSSSLSGCNLDAEAVTSHVLSVRNLACALLVLSYDYGGQ